MKTIKSTGLDVLEVCYCGHVGTCFLICLWGKLTRTDLRGTCLNHKLPSLPASLRLCVPLRFSKPSLFFFYSPPCLLGSPGPLAQSGTKIPRGQDREQRWNRIDLREDGHPFKCWALNSRVFSQLGLKKTSMTHTETHTHSHTHTASPNFGN